MKSLGTDQLLAMKFTRLAIGDEWKGLLGSIPECFVILIYGPSANGKTALGLLLAKEMARLKRVEWMEYESGHAADIQDDVLRTGMGKLPITWTDPWEALNRKAKKTSVYVEDIPQTKNPQTNRIFTELVEKMGSKGSAHFWFINSIDASRFSSEQAVYLMKRFGKRKGIFIIALSEGKHLRKAAAKEIYEQGQAAICVNAFIAQATEKNRFKGFDPFIINEEKARERNPLLFAIEEAVPIERGKKGKKKSEL